MGTGCRSCQLVKDVCRSCFKRAPAELRQQVQELTPQPAGTTVLRQGDWRRGTAALIDAAAAGDKGIARIALQLDREHGMYQQQVADAEKRVQRQISEIEQQAQQTVAAIQRQAADQVAAAQLQAAEQVAAAQRQAAKAEQHAQQHATAGRKKEQQNTAQLVANAEQQAAQAKQTAEATVLLNAKLVEHVEHQARQLATKTKPTKEKATKPADKELEPNTLLHVDGHGAALYLSFEKVRIGANRHTLYFCDKAECRTLALRNVVWKVVADPNDPPARQMRRKILGLSAKATEEECGVVEQAQQTRRQKRLGLLEKGTEVEC